MIGIYKITNLINEKFYIGKSKDIEKRWKRHKKEKCWSARHLHRAILKYGLENFIFEIIEECLFEYLNEREIFWITELKPYYNMTKGGDGGDAFRKKHTEETKQKISKKLKGRLLSEETKKKISDIKKGKSGHRNGGRKKGSKCSEEHKRKISEGRKKYIAGIEATVGSRVS